MNFQRRLKESVSIGTDSIALGAVVAFGLTTLLVSSAGGLAGGVAAAYAYGSISAGSAGVAMGGLAGFSTAAGGLGKLGLVGAGVVGGAMVVSGVGAM